MDALKRGLPELPRAARKRLVAEHGLTVEQALTLQSGGLVPLLEGAIAAGAPAAEAAKWLANEVIAWQHETGRPVADHLTGPQLAELIALLGDGTVSVKGAREALLATLAGEGDPRAVVAARGLGQVSDSTEIAAAVDAAIAGQPEAAQRVRDGNVKAIGALVGHVMKATQGKANPQLVNQLLRERLGGQLRGRARRRAAGVDAPAAGGRPRRSPRCANAARWVRTPARPRATGSPRAVTGGTRATR